MYPLRTMLIAAIAIVPFAATAAELPVEKPLRVHRLHVRERPLAHTGYYWGRWGWRGGGTARYWYASTFGFGGVLGWNGEPGAVASPRGISALKCYVRPPTVCLTEPIVRPVALEGPPRPR